MKATAAVITGIILVVLLSVGLYLGGWWLQEDGVNRTARINQGSFNRQNALVEQILDDIAEAQTAGLPEGQRLAIVDIVCDSYYKLTGSIALPAQAEAFIAKECVL